MAAVNETLQELLEQCEKNWNLIVSGNSEKDDNLFTDLGALLGKKNRRGFVQMLVEQCTSTGNENKDNMFLTQFIEYATTVSSNRVSKRALECDAGPSSPGKKEKQTNNKYILWCREINEEPINNVVTWVDCCGDNLFMMPIGVFKGMLKDDRKGTAFYNWLHGESITSSDASFSTASKISKDAFEIEYKDPLEVVADFKDYVTTCQKNYTSSPAKYMAPYVSLCQSSGYGKSRLLKELANHESVNLLYLAIGDSKQSYPARNARAKEILFLSKENSEAGRLERLHQKLCRCFDLCVLGKKFPETQFDSIDKKFWDEIEKADPISCPVGQKDEKKEIKTLWIAFDEARSLLQESDSKNNSVNDFRLLRRALKLVHSTGRKGFAILVDTESQIANFSPNHKVDASYRPGEGGSLLFHPYILFATHDSLIEANGMNSNFIAETSFLTCGRPLWKALDNDKSEEFDVMDFARKKILKNIKVDVNDDAAMLALALCRCGVFLSPQSSRAKDLAANYMATILLSDCTHERFLVTYLSDPVLSIAATSCWYTNNLLESHILPALRRELTQGAVIEGYLGELVGQILLLIGIDTCQQLSNKDLPHGYDGRWRSLLDFMKNCFEVELDSNVYKTAKVGFSHFIPSTAPPKTCEDLQRLLHRRGASCLPSCHPGADLLIPFWFQEGNSTETVSYILIQIKNRKQKVCQENVSKKLNPCNVFPDGSPLRKCESCIRILMELGIEPKGKFVVKCIDDKDRSITYCTRGLDYPFLTKKPELVQELKLLLKGTLNVDEWITNDEKYNKQLQLAKNHVTRKKQLQKIGFLPQDDNDTA